MANYYGTSRSNYFRVKDPKKWQEFCDLWNLTNYGPRSSDARGAIPCDGDPLYGFGVEQDDYGGLPSTRYNHDTDKDEGDFFQELSQQLAKGEVAICQEVGAEKHRYLTGYAIAVNDKGKCVSIGIEDIYQKARTLLPTKKRKSKNAITRCEY